LASKKIGFYNSCKGVIEALNFCKSRVLAKLASKKKLPAHSKGTNHMQGIPLRRLQPLDATSLEFVHVLMMWVKQQ